MMSVGIVHISVTVGYAVILPKGCSEVALSLQTRQAEHQGQQGCVLDVSTPPLTGGYDHAQKMQSLMCGHIACDMAEVCLVETMRHFRGGHGFCHHHM